jgi:hypothetical protein
MAPPHLKTNDAKIQFQFEYKWCHHSVSIYITKLILTNEKKSISFAIFSNFDDVCRISFYRRLDVIVLLFFEFYKNINILMAQTIVGFYGNLMAGRRESKNGRVLSQKPLRKTIFPHINASNILHGNAGDAVCAIHKSALTKT